MITRSETSTNQSGSAMNRPGSAAQSGSEMNRPLAYSLHVWVQVQCKAATAFPKASANASKLESEVAVDFAMLVALDSPGIGNQLPDDDSGD